MAPNHAMILLAGVGWAAALFWQAAWMGARRQLRTKKDEIAESEAVRVRQKAEIERRDAALDVACEWLADNPMNGEASADQYRVRAFDEVLTRKGATIRRLLRGPGVVTEASEQ